MTTQPPADTRVSGDVEVTQADVTEADKAAVTRFHNIQIKRIMAGDSTLGEDGRQTIEQAFAERRLAGIAEGLRLSTATPVPATAEGVRENWLRGDWYEKWQDATENADEGLMATLEALRGRVEQIILAALTTLSPAQIEAGAFERAAKDVRKAVINELVEEGRAKHRVLNDDQQAAADDDARAFYGKVIDRYTAAIRAEARVPASGGAGVPNLGDGEWFYPEGDHSSEECRFSPDEVIDYALEGEWKSKVVCIERAVSLPSVYAAVRVFTDAEKDERGSDEDYDYTLFATHGEAATALAASPPAAMDGGEKA